MGVNRNEQDNVDGQQMLTRLDINGDKNNDHLLTSSDDDDTMSEASSNDTSMTQDAGGYNDKKPVTILDWRDDSGISDNLYIQSDRSSGCTHARCSGSKVGSDCLLTLDDDSLYLDEHNSRQPSPWTRYSHNPGKRLPVPVLQRHNQP